MACVSYRTFSDAVGVTILKLNLTVQELDQVELGFVIVKKHKMNTVTAMQIYVSPSPFLESILFDQKFILRSTAFKIFHRVLHGDGLRVLSSPS